MVATKLTVGIYEVRHRDGRVVRVEHHTTRDGSAFNGWLAAASWDRYLYTDPLPSKKMAVREAVAMLNGAW